MNAVGAGFIHWFARCQISIDQLLSRDRIQTLVSAHAVPFRPVAASIRAKPVKTLLASAQGLKHPPGGGASRGYP